MYIVQEFPTDVSMYIKGSLDPDIHTCTCNLLFNDCELPDLLTDATSMNT